MSFERWCLGALLAVFAASFAGASSRISAGVWPGFRGSGDSHVAEQELPLDWSVTDSSILMRTATALFCARAPHTQKGQ